LIQGGKDGWAIVVQNPDETGQHKITKKQLEKSIEEFCVTHGEYDTPVSSQVEVYDIHNHQRVPQLEGQKGVRAKDNINSVCGYGDGVPLMVCVSCST